MVGGVDDGWGGGVSCCGGWMVPTLDDFHALVPVQGHGLLDDRLEEEVKVQDGLPRLALHHGRPVLLAQVERAEPWSWVFVLFLNKLGWWLVEGGCGWWFVFGMGGWDGEGGGKWREAERTEPWWWVLVFWGGWWW